MRKYFHLFIHLTNNDWALTLGWAWLKALEIRCWTRWNFCCHGTCVLRLNRKIALKIPKAKNKGNTVAWWATPWGRLVQTHSRPGYEVRQSSKVLDCGLRRTPGRPPMPMASSLRPVYKRQTSLALCSSDPSLYTSDPWHVGLCESNIGNKMYIHSHDPLSS